MRLATGFWHGTWNPVIRYIDIVSFALLIASYFLATIPYPQVFDYSFWDQQVG
jgi:hypothetical protein